MHFAPFQQSVCPLILSRVILNLAKNPQNRALYRRSRAGIILEWAETRVYKIMANNTDAIASTTAPSTAAPTPPPVVDEAPKLVPCRVITDTPVDRVMKGDTLDLPEAIADQFVKLKLVEIVKDK